MPITRPYLEDYATPERVTVKGTIPSSDENDVPVLCFSEDIKNHLREEMYKELILQLKSHGYIKETVEGNTISMDITVAHYLFPLKEKSNG